MTYEWATSLAARLIRAKGGDAQLRRVLDPAVNDPDEPWRPQQPLVTDYPCKAVFLSPSEGYLRLAPGLRGGDTDSDFRAGDMRCLMCALDLPEDPTPMDRVVRSDGEWAIINVKNISPNGERIYFDLQVRR